MTGQGQIVSEYFDSQLLKNNPLGDPSRRPIVLYLPPGYDPDRAEGYPTVLGLTGFTGTGRSLLNVDPFGETIAQRMDRLIAAGQCGPMILVLVDCFTHLGGNQYINSSATGPYEDYLIQEVLPFVQERYNCGHLAVWGKSSGGYGSIILGMRHPEVFSALADHSGDSAFEYCYLPDFPKALDAFRRAGGPARWLEQFWAQPNHHRHQDLTVLNILAMAAHYSPNPESPQLGIDFPFDLETGQWRPDVWQRWLAHDPVRLAEKYADNLRRLKLIYLDCGSRDEFNLHWGMRGLHARLSTLGIAHFYEEFDDGHMNISYRYDRSLPLLYRALSA